MSSRFGLSAVCAVVGVAAALSLPAWATVTLADGHLVLQFRPAAELVGDLRHLHYDTFIVEWRNRFPWFGQGTVQFILDVAGEPVEMKVDVPNEDFWFNELEFLRR